MVCLLEEEEELVPPLEVLLLREAEQDMVVLVMAHLVQSILVEEGEEQGVVTVFTTLEAQAAQVLS